MLLKSRVRWQYLFNLSDHEKQMIVKFFNIVIRILVKKAADYCHFLQDKEITDKNKETSSIHGLGAPVGCKGQEILEGNFLKKEKNLKFLPSI